MYQIQINFLMFGGNKQVSTENEDGSFCFTCNSKIQEIPYQGIVVKEVGGGSFKPKSHEFKKTHPARLTRYNWVLNYVLEKDVLDLGCGHGYGSAILTKKAKMVTGIDIDSKAITYAENNFKNNNLVFYQKPINEIDSVFDVVVCLEIIEHVNDYEDLLNNIKRVLRKGGELILSTPNRLFTERLYKNGKSQNPHHAQEFTSDKLQTILKDYFNDIDSFVLDWPQRDQALKLSEFIAQDTHPKILRRITPNVIKKIFLRTKGINFVPPENINYRVKEHKNIDESFPVQLYRCKN